MLRVLTLYCETQQPVEIIYIANTGIITQRKITIKTITEKNIIAYCHLRGRKRTFSIENILSFSSSKRKKMI